MPSINLEVKNLSCDIALDVLRAKIGDKIIINLKDEKMIFKRLQ